MSKKNLLAKLSLAALALSAIAATPQSAPGPQAAPKKPATATAKDLGGADRFLTYLATDKPIYRANEKVYARAILLNAATHQPLTDNLNAQLQILGPKGEVVASGGADSQDSVVAFAWTVPDSAAGGQYTLKINYPFQGYTPAERKFDVRIYRAPRLRNQITFIHDGYGPGDKVTATVHSERAEGGFPANAKVTIIARVDDQQIFTTPASIDAKGDCSASFSLPKSIERGEGTLAFAIEDGGTVETASKTIPILLQTLDLAIYPEGGDAVAGVDNRFYIEAKTPTQKPADLVGQILDSKGQQVASVKTEHEGRGRFNFTPQKGETYTLHLSQPAGISKTWTLPAAKDSGIVIQTLDNIVAKNQPVRVRIKTAKAFLAFADGDFKLTLTRHEADVAASNSYQPEGSGDSIYYVINPKPDADGVLTLTLWDSKGTPLAERLIYRQPAHQINVQVTPNQSTYTPGGKASLNITTTDESGKPIAANVGLTVTDDTVLELIEKREQAPRLPVMVFLEPEVRQLADAHVYLDPANPKAALATDLLLGTQGWRRFALIRTDDFLNKFGDDAKRALAFKAPPIPAPSMGAMGGGGVNRFAFEAVDAVNVGGAVRDDLLVQKAGEFGLQLEGKQINLGRELAKDADDKQIDLPAALGAAAAMPAQPEMAFNKRLRAQQGPGSFIIVRQYAHDLRPNWSPTDRSDFSETLYWNANLKTDDTGRATADFNLSDSVTSFRIFADSFSKTGALGASSTTIQSVQPFFIEPKIPLEVTAGDVIELPVSLTNNTPRELRPVVLTIPAVEGLKIDSGERAISGQLAASRSMRNIYKVTVGDKIGDLALTFDAQADAFSDKVTRKLRVKPKGFPTQLAYGGLLDSSTPATKNFTVPVSLVPNSLQAFATVYPSPMANLTDAVAALLREPCGCFEQTSSSNYPLAMAAQYFTTHQGIDPQLIAKSNDLLTKGYQRLTGFECKDKGYEWFGTGPGHEALTAYGLMEFHDMQDAKLSIVDDKMLDRTRTWLISRKDAKGGFQRNPQALDSFGGAPELTTNAYIVWALMQAGETSLDKEIAAVRDAAQKSEDTYVLALAANICQLAQDPENAKSFMTRLVKKQSKDGAVDGATTSITRSGGQALIIETTALASLAWQKSKDFAASAQSTIQYLADSCKGGRFGSTQSTILALKAIIAYDQAQAHPKAPGNLVLTIDDKPVGEPVPFTADSKGPLTFPDFSSMLTPGPHSVSIRMTDGSQMPFSFGATYNSVTPSSDKQCKLDLQTVLKDAQIAEGGITEARVLVTNKTDKDAATPVAIIGIPGGLEVRHDQLKELVKAGKIDAYEVNGREVVLYWRQIKAGAKTEISLSLTAAVPGTYTAPASRAYEYYTDEFKQWAEGTQVTITPK